MKGEGEKIKSFFFPEKGRIRTFISDGGGSVVDPPVGLIGPHYVVRAGASQSHVAAHNGIPIQLGRRRRCGSISIFKRAASVKMTMPGAEAVAAVRPAGMAGRRHLQMTTLPCTSVHSLDSVWVTRMSPSGEGERTVEGGRERPGVTALDFIFRVKRQRVR